MRFKITMTEFYDSFIYYQFFDDPNIYQPDSDRTDSVSYNRIDYIYQNGVVVSQTNCYTIEKDSRN